MGNRKRGYLFVHFTGESPEGEQVYFALSRDGLHWQDLNDGGEYKNCDLVFQGFGTLVRTLDL